LIAWKDFFKTNLDTILQPDILTSSFWWTSYLQDYNKAQPKFEPRESCINLLDRDLKQTYFFQLNPEQRKQMNLKYQHVKSKEYLNGSLYELADKMERNFSIWNRFKNDVTTDMPSSPKNSSTTKPNKATWAKIKNTEVVDKVRRILEGKPAEEENPDDDSLLWYDDFYEYPNAS
jgi:hypothetical protein